MAVYGLFSCISPVTIHWLFSSSNCGAYLSCRILFPPVFSSYSAGWQLGVLFIVMGNGNFAVVTTCLNSEITNHKKMAAHTAICQWSFGQHFNQETRRISCNRDGNALELFRSSSWKHIISSKTQCVKQCTSPMPFLGTRNVPKKGGIHALLPNTMSPSMPAELLDSWDDDYNGVVVDSASLPSSANAFASALRASLSSWKLKEKKGIWLKLFQEQSDLVPIAIQEGFDYHHAEPGYIMLTYWIPDEPCTIPSSPSHQIGIAGFVINDNREILVVKEKCSCSCVGVWKLPTGYINKSEEIFSGAIREVKEETGIDTTFLEMVAFRHVHRVAFEKSDLLFVCMLKPLSSEITIDEKEIQDAKWITPEELLGQQFYSEDEMSRKLIEICMATYENCYNGYTAHQLISKFDGKLSVLYYYNNNLNMI